MSRTKDMIQDYCISVHPADEREQDALFAKIASGDERVPEAFLSSWLSGEKPVNRLEKL